MKKSPVVEESYEHYTTSQSIEHSNENDSTVETVAVAKRDRCSMRQ
jgi:hypothetical protein